MFTRAPEWTQQHGSTKDGAELALHCLDAPCPQLPHLGVGQRALERAEPQPVRQAARPLVDPRTSVHVEEPDRLEQLSGRGAKGVGHLVGAVAVGHDERQIDIR